MATVTTTVPLEELRRANRELEELETEYPDAYREFAEFFDQNRGVGYKNLARMLMNEQTPEELKGVDDEAAE